MAQNGAFAEFLIQYLQEQGEEEGKPMKILKQPFIHEIQHFTEVPQELRNRLNSEASIKDMRR